MIRSLLVATLLVSFVGSSLSSHASQPPREPTDAVLEHISKDFKYGNYGKVLELARARIDEGGLTDAELLELHRYAGLSAHALKRQQDAVRHLSAVLRLDPDYSLDPYVTPPATVQLFETLRKDMEDELEVVRRERRLRADQARREATERERRRAIEEEQRRRLDILSRQITVRTVEKRSFLVNFIPFGAGQYQQGRSGAGTVLAVTQGALAATSVVAYFVRRSFYERRTVLLPDRLAPDGEDAELVVRGIPESQREHAQRWRVVQYTSGAAFLGTWAVGMLDALIRHEDEVVSTATEEVRFPTLPRRPMSDGGSLEPSSASGNASALSSTTSSSPNASFQLRARPALVPGFVSNSVGAELTLTF